METVLISIIVPAYNCEKYLSRCIQSLVNQEYKNIEIIIIDDGSTDKTRLVYENWAELDKRIRVYYQDNKGVAYARNRGLEEYRGEYVTFVDADDYVSSDYCSKLFEALKMNDAEVSLCSAYDILEDGNTLLSKVDNGDPVVFTFNNSINFLDSNIKFVSWGVLYYKNVIKDIRFRVDLFVGEDTYFFAEVLMKSKRVVHTHFKLYYYVHYKESASHGLYSEKKYTELDAWKKIINLYSDYPKVQKSCKGAYALRCLIMIKRYYNDLTFYKHKYKKTLKEYRKNCLYLMIYSHYGLKSKGNFLLFYCMPGLYIKIKEKI